MNIALSIGHHPKAQGSDSADGLFTEYSFWKEHLPVLARELEELGHSATVVNRADAGGRTPSYAAAACNETWADLAIEFHFNASESKHASGTETFYWYTSARGKIAAEMVQQAMVEVLHLRDRGIKSVARPAENAYEFFHRTRMPAILVEPAFAGSNMADCNRLRDNIAPFCKALARAIDDFAN